MFTHRDELLFRCLRVDVTEVNIVELHATDLLRLLFDSTTNFQCVFQTATDGLLVVFLVRVQKLQQPGNRVFNDPKSLLRMLSSRGNPNVKNLFSVTQFLQKKAGVQFKVVSSKPKKSKKQELVH